MTAATFWSLTMAAACLWVPRDVDPRLAKQVWFVPGALALVFALAGGLIDEVGVVIVAALGAAAHAANHARHQSWRVAAHVLVIALVAGLFLHVLPGFDNPRLVDHAVLSPGAVPYTQYLNVDKGLAGLLLLGVYVPDRVAHDRGAWHVGGFLWRFVVVVLVVITLSLATGYLRWDPGNRIRVNLRCHRIDCRRDPRPRGAEHDSLPAPHLSRAGSRRLSPEYAVGPRSSYALKQFISEM